MLHNLSVPSTIGDISSWWTILSHEADISAATEPNLLNCSTAVQPSA